MANISQDSQSHLVGHGPISVIDIGSNSVRLVTYERLSRSPSPIFNEKALCGLGSGLAETGMLDEEAVENAIAALHRFKVIADQLDSVELWVIATAAAREASNGADFIERVSEICEVEPILLSGQDESRYSAHGILSGFYNVDGVMGDMGGGSLELADIKGDQIGQGMTFPLGGLRLQDVSDNKPSKAYAVASDLLADNTILKAGKGRAFYAIGGTWRSLAYLHMRQNDYPLRVLHNYIIPAKKMASFCKMIIETESPDIKMIDVISKNRASLLRYGAAVLLKIIEEMKPSHIVTSALGVREGFLYARLDDAHQAEDGLIAGAETLSLLRSRSPDNTMELFEWTSPLFKAVGFDETPEQLRLRKAACLLADVGWRAHPDYRGEQSSNTIAHAAFVGIDHPGRAFIALSTYFRHEGQQHDKDLPQLSKLLTDEDMRLRARLLGLSFRIAHLISASTAGTLLKSAFVKEGDILILDLDRELAAHVGERLIRRLNQITKIIDINVEIRISDLV
ncbi:MAG: Ppx/GppA phosphatase family protein [Hyphomicrobiales bacterium]